MRRALCFLVSYCILTPLPAQCWWENGHRTTARIAAAHLTPAVRTRVAKILGVADSPETVADAMAQASTWPDEIKKDRPETAPWHYIDLALQDSRAQIPDRCQDDNCVTARIKLFTAQLSKKNTAPEGTATADSSATGTSDLDALRFLIHFVGDVHQPLHAISDADQGGNCETLNPPVGQAKNLHALWDGHLVDALNPDDKALAIELDQEIAKESESQQQKISAGNQDDWAWESHEVAEKVVYKKLHIPTEPVVFPASCKDAPEAIRSEKLEIQSTYIATMKPVVSLQLERGGLRLARLLNESL